MATRKKEDSAIIIAEKVCATILSPKFDTEEINSVVIDTTLKIKDETDKEIFEIATEIVSESKELEPPSIHCEIEDYIICKKLIQLRQSAQSRGLEFNLTFKTVKKLLSTKRCFYTNVVMTEDSGMNSRSIDRVDSTKGYIEGNVVSCTVDINSKKGHLTIKEILSLAKNLEKHTKNGHGKKTTTSSRKTSK